MTLPPLTVTEASAGTGKTFSLVTRLLSLVFSGVEPERIVALTFSRMAAGEIFNSFIERLASAASSDARAAEESARLGVGAGRSGYAAMLRKVVSRQHLSPIGTLDSFMARIVRAMPVELGLTGEITVMGDYRAPVERMRLVGEMMSREGDSAKAVFRQAFRLLHGDVEAKSFLDGFSRRIADWHVRFRDLPVPSAWGDAETVWGASPPGGLDATIGGIRAMAAALEPLAEKKGARKFIDAVASFDGTMPDPLPPKSLAEEPAAVAAVRAMCAWKIARELEATRGLYLLMYAYEAAYASKVRSGGMVAFDDMPRLVNSLPERARLPLEYRMDARFDHWALDEFQDTSRGQWDALKNLIDESSQDPGERSVFIVGDRKQSIYDWRGGDVRILAAETEKAKAPGNSLVRLNVSRRYLPAISRAVNRLFATDVVRGVFGMDDSPGTATWECGPHESHDVSSEGFVEVVQAEKAGRMPDISDFFAPVENALLAVRPWERGITCAILVRKRGWGEELLSHLKSRGIDRVVFEGDGDVLDSPVLSAMADMARLSEHPGDAVAYAHLRLSPLAKALFPDRPFPPPDELSASLLSGFTRLGLGRMFREAREALKSVPGSWNEFTESRFEDFMKCASEFESTRDASMRISDFAAFAEKKTRRDYAEPGVVRIMTMHQSKGLGFDHVILPLLEDDTLWGSRHTGPLSSEDPPWIMSNPGSAASMSDPVLARAERDRLAGRLYASLCLDYVAMTRAKKALTLILNPAGKSSGKKKGVPPAYFSDFVRLVGLETSGDREWHLHSAPKRAEDAASAKAPAAPAPFVRRRRETVSRSRPSDSFREGQTADALFAPDAGLAAVRGVEAHGRYAGIEWMDASEARTPFDRAFVRPSPDAVVWRERAYELFDGGRWESGQFDRVVFEGSGPDRRATVYDFKTNAVREGESAADFESRMASAYAGQMRKYRAALSRLAGIPEERVSAALLLSATRSAVFV